MSFDLRLGDKDLARFWGRVNKTDGCWEWQGKPDTEGYGYMSIGGARHRTHRIAWALVSGSLPPEGFYVCHRCDNRICVRPTHLFIGTHLDNVADMHRKGRGSPPPMRYGTEHHSSKVTPDQVAEIRRRATEGETQCSLAREFGLSESSLSAIVRGKTWRAAS